MDVLLYGRLGDLVGRRIAVELPEGGCAIAELREIIAARHPQLREEIIRERVRACVDDKIVSPGFRISPDQRIEFFPPVSGG